LVEDTELKFKEYEELKKERKEKMLKECDSVNTGLEYDDSD